jgi:hypothetical protein
MLETNLYEPVKRYLEGQFATVAAGKTVHLEIAARKGFSEKVKAEIPDHRDIVFKFTKRPDILGFVKEQYTSSLITVEVKGNGLELDDIYQAKLYKEVFDARYGFLIIGSPIPEEIKRLSRKTPNMLQSAGDGSYRFLVVGQFDAEAGEVVDWLPDNPFDKSKSFYWT